MAYITYESKNMISLKQESVLLKKIKSLTELEFSALLKEMSDHIYKNHWSHIIDECFEIDDHEEEIAEMERELESITEEKDVLVDKIDKAITLIDDLEIMDDELQAEVDKIRDELS